MRKPFPGEKASGLLEKTLQEVGFAAFQLEPQEIERLRRELTNALQEKTRQLLFRFPPNAALVRQRTPPIKKRRKNKKP